MEAVATAPVLYTPHPVTLDGQRYEVLSVGETVQQFIDRVIEKADREMLEVKLGGVVVPRSMWEHVKPKSDALLEVRGTVGKQALYIVAMIALTYFTMGAGATAGGVLGSATGAGTFYGMSAGIGAALAAGATFAAGPAIGGRIGK